MVEKPKPGTTPSTLAVVGRYVLSPRVFHHLRTMPAGAGGEIQLTDGIVRCWLTSASSLIGSRVVVTTAGASTATSRRLSILASSIRRLPQLLRVSWRERPAIAARMTFNELRYLVAVAQERNFGRAAHKCFVSQPALSVAIQKLEEELGTRLFERGKNEVT